MSVDPEAISIALSNIALIADDFPTHVEVGIPNKATLFHDLLGGGNPNEALYLLATYCFDVSKRFAILQAAVANVIPTGTPNHSLAVQIDHDDLELNAAGLTWQERANIAGQQLKDWHDRVDVAHQAYLDMAAQTAPQGLKRQRPKKYGAKKQRPPKASAKKQSAAKQSATKRRGKKQNPRRRSP